MNLWETARMLATTVAAFAAVLGGWVMIQSLVRRQMPCGRDKDLLDYMPHGCAGCKDSGQCRRERNHDHELA